MLSNKEVKEINPRLLCRMASQSSRRSNPQHCIDLRSTPSLVKVRLALVSVNNMCTYRMNEAF